MPLVVTPTLQDVYTKLRSLVIDVVPALVQVVQGLDNRVPMPPMSPGFVNMTARIFSPHRTPVASWDHISINPSAVSFEQGMIVHVQLDCYGAASADWAVMLVTVLRTEYACELLTPVAPLFAKDPVQAPLTNGEEQYEERWIVDGRLQYNPIVSTPMQFANAAEIDLINVDERYPP